IKNREGQTIVDILEKIIETQETKIGLICHGFSAHKDFMFNPKIAEELPFDSFRFDFRGYGESDEEISLTHYELYAILSHSKGTLATMIYAEVIETLNIEDKSGVIKLPKRTSINLPSLNLNRMANHFYERNKWMSRVPRYLEVEGVKNFRDLGGYLCTDVDSENSNVLRYVMDRFVFRCGILNKTTEKGIQTLYRFNVRKMFDLRSSYEVKRVGYKEIERITRIHAPVFYESDDVNKLFERWRLYTQGCEGFSKAYMIMLDEGRETYKKCSSISSSTRIYHSLFI
ncbi:15616_t:CDS:2, partial [Acaulospora morrowiae]